MKVKNYIRLKSQKRIHIGEQKGKCICRCTNKIVYSVLLLTIGAIGRPALLLKKERAGKPIDGQSVRSDKAVSHTDSKERRTEKKFPSKKLISLVQLGTAAMGYVTAILGTLIDRTRKVFTGYRFRNQKDNLKNVSVGFVSVVEMDLVMKRFRSGHLLKTFCWRQWTNS